ncbi:unnamed protein product [Urochloa decumbens]|uniref:Uncharacterized protein n=1 Tax=Urochloa decumbens TaxID=240449 RepID=A0ABC8W5N1_9POAL
MANDDPVDDESPRSPTANNISTDNKREQMFILSAQAKYKMAALGLKTNKTSTKASRRPRLQGQASPVSPS